MLQATYEYRICFLIFWSFFQFPQSAFDCFQDKNSIGSFTFISIPFYEVIINNTTFRICFCMLLIYRKWLVLLHGVNIQKYKQSWYPDVAVCYTDSFFYLKTIIFIITLWIQIFKILGGSYWENNKRYFSGQISSNFLISECWLDSLSHFFT